ncbi:MAG: methyltransferase domain-containing protein [Gaiellaceae bacterium]
MSGARYDEIAEWYEREFMASPLATAPRKTTLRLLGDGPGRLLDVGCGTGEHSAVFAGRGWTVTGVDVSEEMLRLARERGLDVVQADATSLPFREASFDAVASLWTHTDLDDFAAVVCEVARVLRPGGSFVYVGGHPCFVGPHSRFIAAEGVPELHPGYRTVGRYQEAPGVGPEGLRAKVGAVHVPLGLFVQTFLNAGFTLERFEEPGDREYPYMVALRARRG